MINQNHIGSLFRVAATHLVSANISRAKNKLSFWVKKKKGNQTINTFLSSIAVLEGVN